MLEILLIRLPSVHMSIFTVKSDSGRVKHNSFKFFLSGGVTPEAQGSAIEQTIFRLKAFVSES